MRALDVRGLKIGGTTTLTIDGDDLGKTPRLLVPFPAKQTLKPTSTDKKAIFDIALANDVEPGYHQLRVATEGGVSLPVVIGVDRIPQQLVTEPTKDLPVALHGSVAGSAIVEAKFQGKAKQRVMVEVESQRLGAKLRPIVHLYSPKKLQVAWAWGTPGLSGDARLEAMLPEDGAYTATLHDAEYAAPAPSYFRLKIGEWAHIDQVFPPVIAKGQPWSVGLLGSAGLPQLTIQAAKNADHMTFPWPGKGGETWSGPRPFVNVSTHAEFVEASPAGKPQEIPAGPAGVSGRLSAPYEEDRYRVAVTPGKKVKLEVFAERIGSPIDCALVVRNEKDVQLARAEDSPGTLDPVLEYAVPDKVTAIVVGVVDAQGRGGPRGIYRLVVNPEGTSQETFNLSTTAQRISIPVGGAAVAPVQVDRKGGYLGSIELLTEPPTRGVKMTGTIIPDGADGALVTFERLDSAPDPMVLTLRGRAGNAAEKSVVVKGHPLERLQPWLATELGVSPTDHVAKEFAITWRDTDKQVISPASRHLLPVALTRPMSKATVKLTLLTSQNTPILNNQPDPNKALRQDKLGELAANVNMGDVTMLVPPELAAPTYDVTVQAELLDAAKKVLATAYTPVRRLPVVSPLVVKLNGPTRIESPFDAKKGASIKLQGKIERREGLKTDVALALTGLPTGAKADAVTVKADASDFAVNITFPPTVAPGEIKGVKISGSYAPDGKTPNVRVRSRDVDVTLVLKAAK